MVAIPLVTSLSSSLCLYFDTMVSMLFSPFLLFSLQRVVSGLSVSIPTSPPSDAHTLSPSLLGFSIEQDRWVDWVGAGSRNDYFYNVLENLKGLSGEATRLRIGADSEDHTNFNPGIKVRIFVASYCAFHLFIEIMDLAVLGGNIP